MTKKKVYCKDCEYYDRDERGNAVLYYGSPYCGSPVVPTIDGWYEKHDIRFPPEINADNNCKYFKRKI